MTNTSIQQSASGYSRGVIFGLTMAEVLLLLIFLATLNRQIEELSKANDALTKDRETLEVANANYQASLNNLDQSTSVSQELFDVVNVLDDNELQKLINNSEIATTYSAEKLEQVISKAKKWDVFTNQPPEPSFTVLDEIEKNAAPEELVRLIENAEIAMNANPETLTEQISKAKKWDVFTNQPPELSFTVLDEIEKNAAPEELVRLIENAEIAMNTNPGTLTEQISKAKKWDAKAALPDVEQIDPKIANLASQVSLNDLELLAAGKLEPAGNNWPPIISLPEAENYSFKIGSAQLTDNFKTQLTGQIVQQILKTLSEYEADLIEVIGHTDLQPMSKDRATNLDTLAKNFFETDKEIALRAKDNVGLGYARALSVTKHLLSTPELKNYTILPYSAAQMITPNGTITTPDDDFESSQLRRIEIRVRRQNK
jgi:outer membrane protein OmpA-like peptidoglycan-associated protein